MIKEDTKIGLCLSGGGSRAVAFHLGCLRALKSYGLLDKVIIISSVSGGSVIAGIYAYGSKDFEDFESKTKKFLKSGLQLKVFLWWLLSFYFALAIVNWILVFVGDVINLTLSFFTGVSFKTLHFRRQFSMTKVFKFVLKFHLFKDKKLNAVSKPGLKVVFNSTELLTCTAFRFGSNEISCWKFGKIDSSEMDVAEAVACSAAYPVTFPSFDKTYEFTKDGNKTKSRVALTDGGIYENLGLTPLLPDRNSEIGYNSGKCNIIVACDAGTNFEEWDGHAQWLRARLIKSFTAVMRRVQSMSFKTLHDLKKEGRIENFILPNLNQDDSKLPFKVGGFIEKHEVDNYPTNFKGMTEENMNKLIARGEQQTTILIMEYLLKSDGK